MPHTKGFQSPGLSHHFPKPMILWVGPPGGARFSRGTNIGTPWALRIEWRAAKGSEKVVSIDV